MRDSKVIAISALSASLSLIFVIIGAYFPTFDISCLFMASLMIMLPLSKKTIKGAILCYLAVSVLSFVFTFGRFEISLLFLLFFGLHPIINYFEITNNKKIILFKLLKTIWFIIIAFVMFYLLQIFIVENEMFVKYAPFFILFGGAGFFIIYDFVMIRFQKNLDVIIKRLKL